jgi:hypothetical protein
MSLILALTAWKATFGLVVVFFVLFPLLLHGLIGFAAAQSASERRENLEFLEDGPESRP